LPPEPLILAFDTAAAHCAAALVSGGRVVAARHEEMATGQAERLFPLLESLIAQAGAGWRDLTALGVGTGPGNFTGVRIAVSAARGLALALSIPAHGITALEALAYGLPRPCLVALDARQGRVYLQGFGVSLPPCLADLSSLPAGLSAPGLVVAGHEAAAIAARIGARAVHQPVPPAEAMALLAAGRTTAPGTRPAPLYLRPADAAPPREAPPVILP
jgi:tRNA threonylcarbamoyl adenosine modification protein YeaZ